MYLGGGMELTKTVVENLGRVFLHIGQGMILGGFLSGFLADRASWFLYSWSAATRCMSVSTSSGNRL